MKTNEMQAWKIRHNNAMANPKDMEIPIVHMVQALASYAHYHSERYDSKIGDDYFLGPAWIDMAKGLRTLLNGDCGRLDCGTLDGAICALITDNGFEGKDWE